MLISLMHFTVCVILPFFSALCKVTTSDQDTERLGKGLNLTTCLQGHLHVCDFYKTNKKCLGKNPNLESSQQ